MPQKHVNSGVKEWCAQGHQIDVLQRRFSVYLQNARKRSD